MSTSTLSRTEIAAASALLPMAAKPGLLDGLLRRFARAKLQAQGLPLLILEAGQPVVTPPAGTRFPVVVRVNDPRFWRLLALDGTNGAAEGFELGWWETDDLVGLVRLMSRAMEATCRIDGGLARVLMPLARLAHRLRPNTRRGARDNIAAHYDLSNDFFKLWLDPSMMYSSALYPTPDATLAEAQAHKLDRLCDLLDLQPGQTLCEIGSGWGALAMHAARRGAQVTTVTISRAQFDLAVERIRDAGLTGLVEVRLCDYRDLTGTWDKVVSVEMVEAIGHQQYPTYMKTISRLLKPGGCAALQAITIREQHYTRARDDADFIKRRIFPGSCIPSIQVLVEAAGRHSDLNLVGMYDLAPHYARTLGDWLQAVRLRRPEILALGFDERFLRRWEFYLAYCAGGFAERAIGCAHMLFAKPGWRDAEQAALIGTAGWEA